ncbi:MAG: helix-turn-helix domain-containing protein [Firmicutes bacterium]|nr:helix-turn-helix domain-containing protein [Bacillota bacterium]
MEKQTIGKFIAILRKASGLTQEELAERLHVSNKSVSRWECDATYPDLSLIPVIAELFGVTSDEILKGARISKVDREYIPNKKIENLSKQEFEERISQALVADKSEKSEKLRKRIILKTVNSFKHLSLISIVLSVTAFMVFMLVMIMREPLQTLIAISLCIISGILQIVLCNTTKASLGDIELDDDRVVGRIKMAIRTVHNYRFNILALNIIMIISFVYAFVGYAYAGEGVGIITALLFIPFAMLNVNIIRMILTDKKYFVISNIMQARLKKQNIIYGIILISFFVLILVGNVIFAVVWSVTPTSRAEVFVLFGVPFMLMAIIIASVYIVKRINLLKGRSQK